MLKCNRPIGIFTIQSHHMTDDEGWIPFPDHPGLYVNEFTKELHPCIEDDGCELCTENDLYCQCPVSLRFFFKMTDHNISNQTYQQYERDVKAKLDAPRESTSKIGRREIKPKRALDNMYNENAYGMDQIRIVQHILVFLFNTVSETLCINLMRNLPKHIQSMSDKQKYLAQSMKEHHEYLMGFTEPI